ncbi:MAG: FlgD immunoglobulin-like domain containing protein [Bacteroidota bacterium]
MTKQMMGVAVLAVASTRLIAGAGPGAPEQLGAHWARVNGKTQSEFMVDGLRAGPGSAALRVMMKNAGSDPGFSVAPTTVAPVRGGLPLSGAASGGSGYSVGTTFISAAVSPEQGIDRLSRGVTREKLGRVLFSTPGPSASYYRAHYTQTAPYVSASYVQFVVDPSWNRIVYGNMNRWIKSYNGLNGPTSIAVDPAGRVFVGETGRERVVVLRLEGDDDGARLQEQFAISGIASPAAVAHSDNGSALDPSDDLLYVADASRNSIRKYRLSATGATLEATFGGFDSPTSIAAGRWNGANNGLLYIVDNVAKRVRVMEESGTSLSSVAEYRGGFDSYFSSIATDHFGNVYLADNTNPRIVKLSASLEYLDEEGGADVYAALAAVDIPFGLITVDGEGTFWAGFDQLFAIERWTDLSGARRRILGLRLKDISFTADQDYGLIAGRFTLTDFGRVGARVFDASGSLVHTITSSAMVSGRKELIWDRRDDAGRLVPPGEYRYELSAVSPYRDETVTAAMRWTLPLYYEERGGIDDQHLVQGNAVHWGSISAAEDPDAVRYRFPGLRPAGTYAVSAEYVAADGTVRLQDLTAGNGARLHDPVQVGASPVQTGFIAVPPDGYASGELLLSVNRRGGGSAVVSRIVLKETGASFTSQPDERVIPTHYALSQNYPNPFNPSTVIRYALPEPGPVTLTVYDIAGREVAQLVNGTQPAGVYEVRFDAAAVRRGGLASGVYFYRVQAGGFSETRKMLLLR